MKNVSDESDRENQNTHFVCVFFYHAIYEKMLKNIVE
jgi:hypothetical protein